MPSKEKTYKRVKFAPAVIKEAARLLVSSLAKQDRKTTDQTLSLRLSDIERRDYDDNEEELFFADYSKEFIYANYRKYFNWNKGKITFEAFFHYKGREYTIVSVSMPDMNSVEKVLNFLEAKVEECSLPKEPRKGSKTKTDWITENVNRIDSYHPITGRKLKLALNKLESEDTEDWQNAVMLIRDAWIELAQHLCFINQIDTSDIPKDAVLDKLRKLGIEKTDEKLFNLARASFNLYSEHHDRKIDRNSAVACVISTIMSMQTIIQEVLHAQS